MTFLDILSLLFKGITIGFILGSWLGYHIGKIQRRIGSNRLVHNTVSSHSHNRSSILE